MLVCLVTKKLVRLTKYTKEELKSRYHTIFTSCLASATVMTSTFGSIHNVIGNKSTTAIGAMYKRRFIKFSFSLEKSEKNSDLTRFSKRPNDLGNHKLKPRTKVLNKQIKESILYFNGTYILE